MTRLAKEVRATQPIFSSSKKTASALARARGKGSMFKSFHQS
jgi:hypothetical protein